MYISRVFDEALGNKERMVGVVANRAAPKKQTMPPDPMPTPSDPVAGEPLRREANRIPYCRPLQDTPKPRCFVAVGQELHT
jgi:hypothetical protein